MRPHQKAENRLLDELPVVVANMGRYGGEFEKAIAEALNHADADNRRRLRGAFPELWQRYLHFEPKEEA